MVLWKALPPRPRKRLIRGCRAIGRRDLPSVVVLRCSPRGCLVCHSLHAFKHLRRSRDEQNPANAASEAVGAASVPPHVRPNRGSSGAEGVDMAQGVWLGRSLGLCALLGIVLCAATTSAAPKRGGHITVLPLFCLIVPGIQTNKWRSRDKKRACSPIAFSQCLAAKRTNGNGNAEATDHGRDEPVPSLEHHVRGRKAPDLAGLGLWLVLLRLVLLKAAFLLDAGTLTVLTGGTAATATPATATEATAAITATCYYCSYCYYCFYCYCCYYCCCYYYLAVVT